MCDASFNVQLNEAIVKEEENAFNWTMQAVSIAKRPCEHSNNENYKLIYLRGACCFSLFLVHAFAAARLC